MELALDRERIRENCGRLIERIENVNVHVFEGREKPLFLISDCYFGVWLEHVYDSVMYAELFPEKGMEIARNTIEAFIDLQRENGQLPCYIWDRARSHLPTKMNIGWGQVQECVSFGSLALKACNLLGDKNLMARCYIATQKWVDWMQKYRMTRGEGLTEMFVGYDTGHDNSGRLSGMRYKENHRLCYKELNAGVYPWFDKVAPIIAVDMNACYFGNLKALAEMSKDLGKDAEAIKWESEAKAHKKRFIEKCYCKEDAFFYDVDKSSRFRKYLSCAVLSLFQEGMLDLQEDKALIDLLLKKHILNPKEFWTAYPFPSMAISDPSAQTHEVKNDWGYFTQGNTELRTTLWMDKYNLSKEQNELSMRYLYAWTKAFDKMAVAQELDPITGEPSPSSPWYSTGMLFYLWSAKRFGII